MIKVDLQKVLNDGDRRNFYRVVPAADKPVRIRSEAGSFAVLEISGGGCSLPLAARPAISGPVILELPGPDGRKIKISLKLRLVNEKGEVLGVEFINLDPDLQETICTYVLRRDIELARQRRARALNSFVD